MAAQHILVPYNFTPFDQRSLDFVADTFACVPGAVVTLLHAYAPIPEIDTRQSTVMDKMQGNLMLMHQQLRERETLLGEVQAELAARGFGEDRVRSVFRPRSRDVAGEIVAAVAELEADVVVISHKRGRVTRFFTGNVFHKVVASLQDVVVCVVS